MGMREYDFSKDIITFLLKKTNVWDLKIFITNKYVLQAYH